MRIEWNLPIPGWTNRERQFSAVMVKARKETHVAECALRRLLLRSAKAWRRHHQPIGESGCCRLNSDLNGKWPRDSFVDAASSHPTKETTCA